MDRYQPAAIKPSGNSQEDNTDYDLVIDLLVVINLSSRITLGLITCTLSLSRQVWVENVSFLLLVNDILL